MTDNIPADTVTQPDRERYSVHWEADCNRWHGRLLTGTFCHWCDEWDDLPIDETCDEFAACTCEWEDDNMTKAARDAGAEMQKELDRRNEGCDCEF